MSIINTVIAPFQSVAGALSSVSIAADMATSFVQRAADKQAANHVNVLAEQANDLRATAHDIRVTGDKLTDKIDLYEAQRALSGAKNQAACIKARLEAARMGLVNDLNAIRVAAVSGTMTMQQVALAMQALKVRQDAYDKAMAMSVTTAVPAHVAEEAVDDVDAYVDSLIANNPL